MKRWLSSLLIGGYLAVLSYGVVCHALSYRHLQHPMMYYIVWDMFCGWSAYADGATIVGEGESGKLYELSPPPWGEIIPYGSVGRRDYDTTKSHYVKMAANTLDHTQHEPIHRILVFEKVWPKKFDIPDSIWNDRYGVPKDRYVYHHLRAEMTGDCRVLRSYGNWHDHQVLSMVQDNPRLVQDSRNAQSFFVVDRPRGSLDASVRAPNGN